MNVLSENDYKLFKTLVQLNQVSMRNTLAAFLERKFDTVYKEKEFLMAVGDIPIALVAHMDTVFPSPAKTVYYDKEQGVLWSPDGLGADDRAGIFAILKIIQKGYKPTVIFTTDEETGANGAIALTKNFPKPPLDLKYVIELDRRGTNDCVFYECNNIDFIEYVEQFGFIENFGSFSDISMICPEWEIAGVNLSIGYEDEHTYSETLHIKPMFSTISKVIKMLQEEMIPNFKYIPRIYSSSIKHMYPYLEEDECKCVKCNKYFSEYEVIPVTRKSGEIVYYCSDCCVDNINWCNDCGEAFEGGPEKNFCPECYTKIKGGKRKCNTKKFKNNLTV